MRTHIPLTVAGWLIGHATGIGWLSSERERRLACQSEQLEESLAPLSTVGKQQASLQSRDRTTRAGLPLAAMSRQGHHCGCMHVRCRMSMHARMLITVIAQG